MSFVASFGRKNHGFFKAFVTELVHFFNFSGQGEESASTM